MGSLIHDWRYLLSKLASLTCRYQPSCQQAMLIDTAGQCGGSTHAMPAFMPTRLEIDLATGQIKNWTVPTGEQLQCIADSHTSHPTTPISKSKQIDIEEAIEEAISASQREQGVIETLMQIEDAIAAAETTAAPVALCEEVAKDDPSSDVVFTVRETGKSHVAEYLGQQKRSLSNSWSPTYSAINLLAQALGMGDVMITAVTSQVDAALGIRKYKIDNSLTKDKLALYVRHDGKRYTARTLGFTGRNATSVSSERAALENLMSKLGIAVDDTLHIVETTDDAMREQAQTRYAVTVPNGWTFPTEFENSSPAVEPEEEPSIYGRGPVMPRYLNPATGETWSGRGKHPAWLLAEIAAGGSLADFLIGSPPTPTPTPTPTPDDAPATYADICAAIAYASTTLQAAALVNRINKHTDYDQRHALHAALQNRIAVIKAAESA